MILEQVCSVWKTLLFRLLIRQTARKAQSRIEFNWKTEKQGLLTHLNIARSGFLYLWKLYSSTDGWLFPTRGISIIFFQTNNFMSQTKLQLDILLSEPFVSKLLALRKKGGKKMNIEFRDIYFLLNLIRKKSQKFENFAHIFFKYLGICV